MIEILSPARVLERTGRALALSELQSSAETITAQSLRRAVSALAPCSRAEALRFARQPLASLLSQPDEWFEAVLDELIAYGDILEVTLQDQDNWQTEKLVLRPAPPSFVRRANGDLIILGVAGDQPTALLGELDERLLHRGTLRTLEQPLPSGTTDLLKALGLIELVESAWLRAPATTSAQSYSEQILNQLHRTEVATAPVEGLSILDPAASVKFYSGRWRLPGPGDSGVYIARRRQLFGLRPWCLAELDKGLPRRLQDLVATDDQERPCDLAWRIQAAFDATAGRPQLVRPVQTEEAVTLEFFSPLPAFAERRLAARGEKLARSGCLFAYSLSPTAAREELAALSEKLWLIETH